MNHPSNTAPSRLALSLTILLAALTLAIVSVPRADAAIQVTDSVGPALPDPKAWWAGTCDRASAPAPGVAIPGGVGARSATDPNSNVGNPSSVVPGHCIDVGEYGRHGVSLPPYPSPWISGPAWRLAPMAAAGAHPDASATFHFDVELFWAGGTDSPVEAARTVMVDVPAGVIGDPLATRQCTQEAFAASPHECGPESQVGITTLRLDDCSGGSASCTADTQTFPIYNLEPREGFTAEFGIPDVGLNGGLAGNTGASVRIFAKARTDGDFGVTTGVMAIPTQFPFIGQTLTFWGVPYSSANDEWRWGADDASARLQGGGNALPVEDRASYDPSWGPVKPFFSNPTECDGQQPVTTLFADSYENTGRLLSDGLLPDGRPDPSDPLWFVAGSAAELVTGCEQPPFDPRASIAAGSSAADEPAELAVDIDIPANDDPPAGLATNADEASGAPAHWRSAAGRATAHLDKTVVELAEGMSVNPSAATGLQACSDAQMGVTAVGNPYRFDNSEPSCPEGSKIGTVTARTPLLHEALSGEMILGEPRSTDPQSGQMFRTFLVLRNKERGLIAKVFGSSVADPATGRLTATFDKNPRVPVEDIEVRLDGGPRGVLATPASCGTKTTRSTFTPWTATHGQGGVAKTVDSSFGIDQRCGQTFAPVLAAGMDTREARSNGTFSFQFSRPDGDQYLRGLTARLPKGLLASVRDVPLCTDAQADAGACPAGSKIGIVDAKAGAGDPFVLEQKGELFLTQGYKGGQYGLAVKIRPVAGPFRGAMELSPIIVRQAIHVDRSTAQVTATSDPFPVIHHGVPLRVREVTVLVDRERFMLNPSDCQPKRVGADLLSDHGNVWSPASEFRASGCADLAFKPRLGLRLTGKRQVRTGKHPGIRAVVRQRGIPEAGIERAQVRLPKSLALDVDNAQALCEFADGTRPDLENHCPKGSIVGRARAKTPLLNDDLVGNVYFVKNVRTDPDTGNAIRTLPMIVVALRGEIAVNLVGESDVHKGKLVNTFDEVPDAPITRFNLNIKGGKNGIVAVTRTRRGLINLCARPKRHIAEADMDGQNGRRYDRDIRMKTPCAKRSKKTKAQRRKAAKRRTAAKRKASRD